MPGREWIRVYQGSLEQVVTDRVVTQQPLRLLLYLMACQGYGAGLAVDQGTVGAVLGMSRSNVSRALKLLRAQGWVSRTRSKTGTVLYCLNRRLVHKGQAVGAKKGGPGG